MIGKPDDIPADWTSWWEVRLTRNDESGVYAVVRSFALDGGGRATHDYAWFVQESHADEFAKVKNDQLRAGIAN